MMQWEGNTFVATLHILNKLAQPLELCLSALAQGDSVILIEEAVYALLQPELMKQLSNSASLYVLDTDAKARGIAFVDTVSAVNYEQFVDLTVQHDKSISWY